MVDKDIPYPHPIHMPHWEDFGQETALTWQCLWRLPHCREWPCPKLHPYPMGIRRQDSLSLMRDGLIGNILLRVLCWVGQSFVRPASIWLLPLLPPSLCRCWSLVNVLWIDICVMEDLKFQSEADNPTWFYRQSGMTRVYLEVKWHAWRCILGKQIQQECV